MTVATIGDRAVYATDHASWCRKWRGRTLTKDDLLACIRDELRIDTTNVDEGTPPFSSCVVDSFGMISLLSYFERERGLRVTPLDVNLENMDTIRRILTYVERSAAAA